MEFTYLDSVPKSINLSEDKKQINSNIDTSIDTNINTNIDNAESVVNSNIRLSENIIPRNYIYIVNSTYFGPFSYNEKEIKVNYYDFNFNLEFY